MRFWYSISETYYKRTNITLFKPY